MNVREPSLTTIGETANTDVTGLLIDHLDLWTGAVTQKRSGGRGSNGKVELTGIKKLRELILELAVRGKLVEQDPNDEPASVLLERIAEEKARLVKEGKIKKPKKLPEITEDEKPFELPPGWSWARLGTIAQISPRNDADDEILASFVPMPLISTSFHGEHSQEPRPWGEIKKGYTHFADGDIAIAKITPCFENSKAAVFRNLENGIGAGTTELHIARPYGETLNPLYILLCLKSPRFLSTGEEKMTGSAGQKRVPKDFFSGEPLPLPPLAEQHRIVEKVEELMALCDRLEQQVGDQLAAHEVLVDTLLDALTRSADAAELAVNWARIAEHFDTLFTTEASIDKLKQTVLHLAVTGKTVKAHGDKTKYKSIFKDSPQKQELLSKSIPNFPSHWKPSTLLEASEIIVDCPHSTPKWSDSGFICVRTNQFMPGKLDLSNSKYVNETTYLERIKRLEPEKDDILYSREGGILGVACRVPPGVKLCLGQRMMLIRPNKEKTRSQYLEMVLNSPFIKSIAENNTTGGAAPRVNMFVIKNYPTPIPPLNEQDKIIESYETFISLCDQLNARLGKAGETRANLAEAVVEQAVS
ncbi:restriction endonuclease subunit S [Halomonas ramblicola]|uniref:restriction endonuclease subunit S n=1 Tax=Halomonas ramblicola TaxID=747349 RepID=UPI0025B4CD76|nr:restriction endonuclease subunit S [Halomonas ramblicola]MDN3523076.1 restriction endonuclease subunit S [Halomonas ramblicola]